MRNTSAIQPMKPIFLPGLVLLLSLTSAAQAQENGELGRMWTFENPPFDYLEKEYGFEPDQEWLNALRLGSLRLGGELFSEGVSSSSVASDWNTIPMSQLTVHRNHKVT